jgi:AcrR family transcriptional regulator
VEAKTARRVQRSEGRKTREKILEAARRLFIVRGIGAVTYGDIAEQVGTTRANLHYHFGNKAELVQEVFQVTFDKVNETFRRIWLEPGMTLDERLEETLRDARQRFEEFNPSGTEGNPWSLTARARSDFSALNPEMLKGIAEMSRRFEENVAHAVKLAIGSGELRPDAPVRDIVLLIAPLWYFGSPITQFAGWRKLEQHYKAVRCALREAYGVSAPAKVDG